MKFWTPPETRDMLHARGPFCHYNPSVCSSPTCPTISSLLWASFSSSSTLSFWAGCYPVCPEGSSGPSWPNSIHAQSVRDASQQMALYYALSPSALPPEHKLLWCSYFWDDFSVSHSWSPVGSRQAECLPPPLNFPLAPRKPPKAYLLVKRMNEWNNHLMKVAQMFLKASPPPLDTWFQRFSLRA